ncbi:hypothetical protein TrVFT333_007381 [Trichoderma virens FT-333]|nr:hypothetical protein TrVFT333_007381 [Trichoderma virens FT-333]
MPDRKSPSSSVATLDNSTSSTLAVSDAVPLEASSASIPNDTPTQSVDQDTQTNAVELHDDPTDEDTECHSRSTYPPSPSQPSPAFTFAVLDDPLPPPIPTPIPFTKPSTQPILPCLPKKDSKDAKNASPASTASTMASSKTPLANGPTSPTAYTAAQSPRILPHLRPLHPPLPPRPRSPSIVRYLLFNVLPIPDHAHREKSCNYQIHVNHPTSQKRNMHLLHAIKQLDWIDETVDWVAKLARTEDERTLSTLYKARGVEILPTVWKKMLEMEEKWKPGMELSKFHARVVAHMQRNRPNSLLSNIVTPQDIVEDS